MNCDFCGEEGARIRLLNRTYGKGEAMFIIENVPVVNCPHCGESYLTAATAHALDRIRSHSTTQTAKREIAVAEFS